MSAFWADVSQMCNNYFFKEKIITNRLIINMGPPSKICASCKSFVRFCSFPVILFLLLELVEMIFKSLLKCTKMGVIRPDLCTDFVPN